MHFRNVIIFGATGDVGSAFVSLLSPISEKMTLAVRNLSKLNPEFAVKPHVSVFEFNFPENTASLGHILSDELDCFDLVVNAIGSYSQTTDILNISHFESLINSNFNVLQKILLAVRPFVSEESKFINISSIASHAGGPEETAYSSSKALVDKLMDSLRFDEKYKNVRTLNVRPGAIIGKTTESRQGSSKFIDPHELAKLCVLTVCAGNSLTVPVLDVYRRSY